MLAVIAAGGEPPEREEFLWFAEKAGLVIAADSGLEWLRAFGYTPEVMVGDFDSTGKRTVDLFLGKHVKTVTVPVEKDDTDTMLAAEYAARAGQSPYYLYRQKNMAGNFENVGYSKEGKAGIYNILIMEEVQSILALGAGASTKMVWASDRIERIENVKDIRNYIDRIDEMIERKRSGIHE